MTNFKHKKKSGTCPGTSKGTAEGQQKDTNNNDNNIYLILFNKYKERVRAINFWGEKFKIIHELKEDSEYLKLSEEEQEHLVNELITS